MEAFFSVKDLKIYYETRPVPVKAVDGVSFSLARGEILGIAGESGCGKSTLAMGLLKLIRPPGRIIHGKVLLDGVDLLSLSEKAIRRLRWRKISYVPQGSMNSLNPVKKIHDQIADVIKAKEKRVKKKEIRRWVEEAFKSVGLPARVANMYPFELSGGMKQRVVIAMEVIFKPDLIIADEPTTALDVTTQKGIAQMLLNIRQTFGSSLILITHDMALHAQVVDKLVTMYAGKVVEIGNVTSIFEEPLHPYTKALISSMPTLVGRKELSGIKGLPPDLRHPPQGCRFHPRCPYFIPGKCDVEEPLPLEVERDRLVACHLYGGV